MYRFKSVEETISERQLLEMEMNLKVEIPKDFKNFLLNVNVGVPKEKYLSFFIDEVKEEVIFGVMLGVSENKNFSLVDWNLEYQSELPCDSFIFGTEYGGGVFVMIVSGEDKGVYFWDHTFIFEKSSLESIVYFLADDFTDFLQNLYFFEE